MTAARLLFLLCLPALAQAQDDTATWHIALRGGMHIHEDQAFDFVSEDSVVGASEIALDRQIFGPLWVGIAWRAGGSEDRVFDTITTTWTQNNLQASAMFRLRPLELMAVYGRLGPAASRVELELTTGRRLAADAWTFGGHAGLGVEFFPVHRSLVEGVEGDFGLGLSLELTYARYAPVDLQAGTTDLGTFDPSGPGLLMGLAVQW